MQFKCLVERLFVQRWSEPKAAVLETEIDVWAVVAAGQRGKDRFSAETHSRRNFQQSARFLGNPAAPSERRERNSVVRICERVARSSHGVLVRRSPVVVMTAASQPPALVFTRARNGLTLQYVGDSLAMPIHWFYTPADIPAAFPPAGVTKLEAAPPT